MEAIKAFTMVEVLLVVLILAVLASLVIPRVAESSADSKRTKCDSDRINLIDALERYALGNDGVFPAGQGNFRSDILNSTTYFPHGSPVCPFGTAYVYINPENTVVPHSH